MVFANASLMYTVCFVMAFMKANVWSHGANNEPSALTYGNYLRIIRLEQARKSSTYREPGILPEMQNSLNNSLTVLLQIIIT